MSAELFPSSSLPLTPEGPFSVPDQFYSKVCKEFTGQAVMYDSVRHRFAKSGGHPPQSFLNIWKLGNIRFVTKQGLYIDLVFYADVEPEVMNFSIGNNLYCTRTDEKGGGLALYLLLDKVANIMGVHRPPPYPPPILSAENIVSLFVWKHKVPTADIARVMRWFEGRHELVAKPWPSSAALGELTLTLRDGSAVIVQYYEAPRQELRFSIQGRYYRLFNRYTSSFNLDAEIQGLRIK